MQRKSLTIIAIACALIIAGTLAKAQDAGWQVTSLESRFKQLDRNGDGKLSCDEIPQLFDPLDANRDGAVPLDEVKEYCKRSAADGAGQSRADYVKRTAKNLWERNPWNDGG